MKRALSLIGAVVLMAGVLVQAATQSPTAPSSNTGNITGSWTMTMVNRSEPVNLDLKVDGEPWDGRIPDPDIWNTINYIKSLAQKKQ